MEEHEKPWTTATSRTNTKSDDESDNSSNCLEPDITTKLSESDSPENPDPQDDQVHQNICLLTRDLLYVAELLRAVSNRDYGRIEDILGNLAMMFWGAGSNNYCTELLHFIFNLKMIWGDDFG